MLVQTQNSFGSMDFLRRGVVFLPQTLFEFKQKSMKSDTKKLKFLISLNATLNAFIFELNVSANELILLPSKN